MKTSRLLFLFWLLCLPMLSAAQRLKEKIDSLLTDPYFQTTQISILIYDLTADSTLYAYQPFQRMRPASCQKVVTAIAALAQLGPSHSFLTAISTDGKLSGHTLVGNIYCRGGFDPLVGEKEMQMLASQLRQQNIDTLCGQIYADLSMKSGKKWGEGWCWDDKNPTLSPLLFQERPEFCSVLLQTMRKAGIVVVVPSERNVGTERRTPSSAHQLAQVSHSLEEVIIPMLKESNNLIAEAVFYHLSAESGKTSATANQSRLQIKKLLSSLDITEDSYNIADGSGLSLYNYTTAYNLVRLLRFADTRKAVFEPFTAALPIAGVDGTLKKRMLQSEAFGRVRAKTGTLIGVSSLAGYVTAANHHRLCFAFINQGVASHSSPRAFQDELCQLLASYNGGE